MNENQNNTLNEAIDLFERADYIKAYELFYADKSYFEAGFCQLLLGRTDLAKELFDQESKDTPALAWTKSLLNMVLLKPFEPIPFFQIRNYLEKDINLLLKAGRKTYAENVVSYSDSLAVCNPETYKFIGRVLISNSYYDLAKQFLEKSVNIHYNDPELHTLLAKYWLYNNNLHLARYEAKKAIEIAPEYFPARQFLENIS